MALARVFSLPWLGVLSPNPALSLHLFFPNILLFLLNSITLPCSLSSLLLSQDADHMAPSSHLPTLFISVPVLIQPRKRDRHWPGDSDQQSWPLLWFLTIFFTPIQIQNKACHCCFLSMCHILSLLSASGLRGQESLGGDRDVLFPGSPGQQQLATRAPEQVKCGQVWLRSWVSLITLLINYLQTPQSTHLKCTVLWVLI